MNTELQKEIFTRLDALAAKLGVAAEYLFHLYVRQAILNGIEYTICSLIFLATTVCLFQSARKALIRRHVSKPFATLDEIAGIRTFFAVVCGLFAVSFMVKAIDHLANPQYWAFQALLDSLRN